MGFSPNQARYQAAAGFIVGTIMRIKFQVLGDPQAQKRHKHYKRGSFVKVYDPSEEAKTNFLLTVQEYAPKSPILGDIMLTVWFLMPRPRNHYGTGKNQAKLKDSAPINHTKKPDIDNLLKFIMDSLGGRGIYWKDDAQVYSIIVQKLYSDKPRTVIQINY